MPKGKITRLSDPSNPYGKGKVTRSDAKPPARPAPNPGANRITKKTKVERPSLLDRAKSAGSGKIKELNDRYGGGARKRRIDDAIEGRTSRRKR